MLKGDDSENGFKSVKFSRGVVSPAVNNNAAASPNTLPDARMAPVKIEGTALGTSTVLTVCHLDTPKARSFFQLLRNCSERAFRHPDHNGKVKDR